MRYLPSRLREWIRKQETAERRSYRKGNPKGSPTIVRTSKRQKGAGKYAAPKSPAVALPSPAIFTQPDQATSSAPATAPPDTTTDS